MIQWYTKRPRYVSPHRPRRRTINQNPTTTGCGLAPTPDTQDTRVLGDVILIDITTHTGTATLAAVLTGHLLATEPTAVLNPPNPLADTGATLLQLTPVCCAEPAADEQLRLLEHPLYTRDQPFLLAEAPAWTRYEWLERDDRAFQAGARAAACGGDVVTWEVFAPVVTQFIQRQERTD